jgi:hypothetical protein
VLTASQERDLMLLPIEGRSNRLLHTGPVWRCARCHSRALAPALVCAVALRPWRHWLSAEFLSSMNCVLFHDIRSALWNMNYVLFHSIRSALWNPSVACVLPDHWKS